VGRRPGIETAGGHGGGAAAGGAGEGVTSADGRWRFRFVRKPRAPEGESGRGQVRLPEVFERKAPAATTDWRWQWVFPSATISVDPRTGWRGRHHLHEGTVSREISQAGRRAHLSKRPTAHSLRHAPAGGGLRHPHGPGIAGPHERRDDDDLHPCAEQGRPGRTQPSGSALKLAARGAVRVLWGAASARRNGPVRCKTSQDERLRYEKRRGRSSPVIGDRSRAA
jgi:hypothetical protein